MSKLGLSVAEALYPVPVVLVSSIDRNTGKANIITIAWCGVVASNPPLISISIRPSRYSHGLILSQRDFCVNIPSRGIIRQVDYCGLVSGRDIDKFSECKFTSVPASKIASPLIKECPVNIECTVKDILKLGSRDMFIGEVVAVHADSEVVDGRGKVDHSNTNPLVFSQGEYWSLDSKIGHYGFSHK